MADEKTSGRPLDSTGETVRSNLRRIRDRQGISGPDLSAKLIDLGRPIPPLGIHRIEAGKRRVDVDDLMALAVALQVSPISLLMPVSDDPEAQVTATGVGPLTAYELLSWLRANGPLQRQARTANMRLSLPEWDVEYELERIAKEINDQVSITNRVEALEAELERLQARGND